MEKTKILEHEVQSIISWYEFKKDGYVLLITKAENLFLQNFFRSFNCKTIIADEAMQDDFLIRHKEAFDYIIAIGVLEGVKSPVRFLSACKKLVAENGILLLGTENRLALKFFLGDTDPYSFRSFDGIEGYANVSPNYMKLMTGRCYAKNELRSFLTEAGWSDIHSYSILNSLDNAHLIFAEDYRPKEELSLRCFSEYLTPENIPVRQEKLYSSLIKNDLFHQLADAYLFECSIKKNSALANILQVTSSTSRLYFYSQTSVRRNGIVMKKFFCEKYKERMEELQFNTNYLTGRGIKTVPVSITGDSVIMPYIEAETANTYLRNLAYRDKEAFVKAMDDFRNLILKSSEISREDPHWGSIMKHGFVDMVPLNAFYIDGDFVFFDQEFTKDDYPVDAIVYRFLSCIYEWDFSIEKKLEMGFFMNRYNLWKQEPLWRSFSEIFVQELEGKRNTKKKHATDNTIASARNNFKFHFIDKNKMLFDPFGGYPGQNVIVVGTGDSAHKFLALYHSDFDIRYIISNSDSDREADFFNYKIRKMHKTAKWEREACRFIICDDSFEYYLHILLNMGVKDIRVYEKDKIYSGRQILVPSLEAANLGRTPKKYHIGYITGVFDQYPHMYLKKFQQAKDLCDYLIAGIASDRYVTDVQKRTPLIPFEERLKMVRSFRYIDEAQEIPFEYSGTVEAYQKYHFDVQFSDSYNDDPDWWLQQKSWLKDHKADLVFYTCTQQDNNMDTTA